MYPEAQCVFLFSILSLFVICESVSLASSYTGYLYNRTVSRSRRQAGCDGFQCKTTPQCIGVDRECDGIEDCTDGSDEYEILCKDIPCPGYLFKCAYGACIDTDKRCDGVKDCKDNSDEAGCPKQEKINTNCRSDQFECDNGQCIEIDGKCNGIADCEDKSDETERLCFNIFCPGYTDKCAYGACIDGGAKCNGVKDCLDNSDEDEKACGPPVTSLPTPIPTKPSTGGTVTGPSCVAPDQPENGKWVFLHNREKGEAGKKVSTNGVIIFSCNNGFQLSSTLDEEQIVVCIGDAWTLTKFPVCQQQCPAYYSSQTITVTCRHTLTGSLVPCNKATDHTKLTYECAIFYEPSSSISTLFCFDGSWNYPKPSCIQVCGEKRVSATPLIVNGVDVERGNYPWVTAIYSNIKNPSGFTNICGGSLLSQNLVLTAAHCVTTAKGVPHDAKHYRVGAGKYYNPFDDPRDSDTAQYTEVAKILVHQFYKGEDQNFVADIAILKLGKPFALSKVVQPVCYQQLWNNIGRNDVGLVTGWGYTESSGKPADVLKEVELPYKDPSQCESELPADFFNRYFTHDKMCAGKLNSNTSVCKGDSGGGLVFKHRLTGRFHIHGIVSIGRTYKDLGKISCDIQKSALFTKVEPYSDWLQQEVARLSSEN